MLVHIDAWPSVQNGVNSMTGKTLTTKQFGDACEHAVMAELGFANLPSVKMPDNWPGYDILVANRPDGRISVKGTRKGTCYVNMNDAWDWVALVWIKDDDTRELQIIPRSWLEAMNETSGYAPPNGECFITHATVGQEIFRDNFRLETFAPETAKQMQERREHRDGIVFHAKLGRRSFGRPLTPD
jgi:hypothetical protein